MSESVHAIDLPERDPGLPRFALALAGLAIIGCLWLLAAPLPGRFSGHATRATTAVPTGLAEPGRDLFVSQGCGACHAVEGPPTAGGPSLGGALGRAAARVGSAEYSGEAKDAMAYLREAILDHCADPLPGYDCGKAPAVGLRLSERQIDELVGFVATLPGGTMP